MAHLIIVGDTIFLENLADGEVFFLEIVAYGMILNKIATDTKIFRIIVAGGRIFLNRSRRLDFQ